MRIERENSWCRETLLTICTRIEWQGTIRIIVQAYRQHSDVFLFLVFRLFPTCVCACVFYCALSLIRIQSLPIGKSTDRRRKAINMLGIQRDQGYKRENFRIIFIEILNVFLLPLLSSSSPFLFLSFPLPLLSFSPRFFSFSLRSSILLGARSIIIRTHNVQWHNIGRKIQTPSKLKMGEKQLRNKSQHMRSSKQRTRIAQKSDRVRQDENNSLFVAHAIVYVYLTNAIFALFPPYNLVPEEENERRRAFSSMLIAQCSW